MKNKLCIVNILMIDAKTIELTCNNVVTKKLDLSSLIGTNLKDIQQEIVDSTPKMFKVVVSRDFYEKNNLNVYKTINIDVTGD